MKECTHKIGWFSTRFTYPPIIGKMSTCWRCGHTKAGSNTVTFSANHIDMTHASAPADPSAGAVRIFSTGTTNLTISNTDADDHTFGGGGATVLTVEGSQRTEASTTSTSAADLSIVGSLNIAGTKPIIIQHLVRGAKGGASALQDLGLELNGTLNMGIRRFSYGTADMNGLMYYFVGQRQTNYVRAIGGSILVGGGSGGYNNLGAAADNDIATTITSVTVSGLTGAGTLYSDEVFVQTLATS
jgi:hypothetical protein